MHGRERTTQRGQTTSVRLATLPSGHMMSGSSSLLSLAPEALPLLRQQHHTCVIYAIWSPWLPASDMESVKARHDAGTYVEESSHSWQARTSFSPF